MSLASTALAALAIVGCGARTAVELGTPDAGDEPHPLEVECDAQGGEYFAPAVPIAISARAEGGESPEFLGWDVVIEPAGSLAEPTPPSAAETSFTAELTGGYRLRATFRDGAVHADCTLDLQVVARPIVDCGDEERTVPAGTNVVLEVAAAGAEPLGFRWVVEERPPGSTASPEPDDQATSTFRPDREGEYLVGVQVVDRFGAVGACNVRIVATDDPTRIECDDVDAAPRETVPLLVRYLGEGSPRSYAWTLEGAPTGSSAAPPAPPDAASPDFTPDLAGEYVVQVVVEFDTGDVLACALTVHAFPTEALRVEAFWNPPDRSCDGGGVPGCDDSDVDLHLLHPDGAAWFNGRWDCHWDNCDSGLSWDAPGEDDDAFLDLDDTSGFGPENINVAEPADGTFRVGVHYYDDGDRWDQAATVTVRIYCGDAEPEEVGPRALSANDAAAGENDFWKVADVTFEDGVCSLVEIDDVVTTVDARNAR